jgi:predicted TIM-barrel fold metal-dependent hydrolase
MSASLPGMAGPLDIVDFHSHHLGPRWPAALQTGGASAPTDAWTRTAARIADAGGLTADLDAAGIDARVLCGPPSLVNGGGERLPGDSARAINDHLAARVAEQVGRLFGLATVDAFAGDESAREVERAVGALGLQGIVVDCASGDLLLDDPSARPTLLAAAHLGAPVFVHPVTPRDLPARLRRLGRWGIGLARGTEDAACLLALVEAGVLDQVAGLRLVFPWLGAAGLLLSATSEAAARLRRGARAAERWHVYVDTMGFDAAGVRYAVELLGADHVLVGSDWPIGAREASRELVTATLREAGLDDGDQRLVAGGNARALVRGAAGASREVGGPLP